MAGVAGREDYVKIEIHGEETVIWMSPDERDGLFQLIAHIPPRMIADIAASDGSKMDLRAVLSVVSDLYLGLQPAAALGAEADRLPSSHPEA